MCSTVATLFILALHPPLPITFPSFLLQFLFGNSVRIFDFKSLKISLLATAPYLSPKPINFIVPEILASRGRIPGNITQPEMNYCPFPRECSILALGGPLKKTQV